LEKMNTKLVESFAKVKERMDQLETQKQAWQENRDKDIEAARAESGLALSTKQEEILSTVDNKLDQINKDLKTRLDELEKRNKDEADKNTLLLDEIMRKSKTEDNTRL